MCKEEAHMTVPFGLSQTEVDVWDCSLRDDMHVHDSTRWAEGSLVLDLQTKDQTRNACVTKDQS